MKRVRYTSQFTCNRPRTLKRVDGHPQLSVSLLPVSLAPSTAFRTRLLALP